MAGNVAERGVTLVEVLVALTIAAGGIVATAATLATCSDLRATTRRATEDRQLTREVFADLRGSDWQSAFDALHATALMTGYNDPPALPGGQTRTVDFPASALATALGSAPPTGSRFADLDGDGIVDLDSTATTPGLFPVRVVVEDRGRTISYFALVRTP